MPTAILRTRMDRVHREPPGRADDRAYSRRPPVLKHRHDKRFLRCLPGCTDAERIEVFATMDRASAGFAFPYRPPGARPARLGSRLL